MAWAIWNRTKKLFLFINRILIEGSTNSSTNCKYIFHSIYWYILLLWKYIQKSSNAHSFNWFNFSIRLNQTHTIKICISKWSNIFHKTNIIHYVDEFLKKYDRYQRVSFCICSNNKMLFVWERTPESNNNKIVLKQLLMENNSI